MGGDGEYAQGPGGFPPPFRATDHGDVGEEHGRRRVGVPLSSVGNIIHEAPPHRGVHQEAAGDHGGKGGLTLPDVHPDGVEPHGFHYLHYLGVLPLSACHALLQHPRDLLL